MANQLIYPNLSFVFQKQNAYVVTMHAMDVDTVLVNAPKYLGECRYQ